jgi:urease subunit alpha
MTFISQAGLAAGAPERYGPQKTIGVVKNNRSITKRSMIRSDYLPKMEIDAQTYQVRADGVLLTCEPAVSLSMAQRYFLF